MEAARLGVCHVSAQPSYTAYIHESHTHGESTCGDDVNTPIGVSRSATLEILQTAKLLAQRRREASRIKRLSKTEYQDQDQDQDQDPALDRGSDPDQALPVSPWRPGSPPRPLRATVSLPPWNASTGDTGAIFDRPHPTQIKPAEVRATAGGVVINSRMPSTSTAATPKSLDDTVVGHDHAAADAALLRGVRPDTLAQVEAVWQSLDPARNGCVTPESWAAFQSR